MTPIARALVTLTIPDGESTEATAQRVTAIAERLTAASRAAIADAAPDDKIIGTIISHWWQGDHHASKGEFHAATGAYGCALRDFLQLAMRLLGQETATEWERVATALIEGYNREAGIINAEQEINHGGTSVH